MSSDSDHGSIHIPLLFVFSFITLTITVVGMCYYAFFYKERSTKQKEKSSKGTKAENLNLVLYANGLYENLEKPNALWQQGIEQSDFNTIILWTLHIRSNGDLVYNDYLMVSNGELEPLYGTSGTNIASRIQELKSFGNVNLVLFSIGSGSWYDNEGILQINPDFYNLHNILFNGTDTERTNLYNNFKVLIDLGIDGFDSDCEEWGFFLDLTSEQLEKTHVEFFTELYNINNDLVFTFVPYRDRENWLNIAIKLYSNLGVQIIRFWSVQMYGPGSGTVQSWINDIRNNSQQLGLNENEINNYIIPGYDNSGIYWPLNIPLEIQRIFSNLKGPDVNGGMIWNLSQTYERGQTLDAYSNAIITGLSDDK